MQDETPHETERPPLDLNIDFRTVDLNLDLGPPLDTEFLDLDSGRFFSSCRDLEAAKKSRRT